MYWKLLPLKTAGPKLAGVGLVVATFGLADAADYVVIGHGQPAVVVDLRVLDALPDPPNIADYFLRGLNHGEVARRTMTPATQQRPLRYRDLGDGGALPPVTRPSQRRSADDTATAVTRPVNPDRPTTEASGPPPVIATAPERPAAALAPAPAVPETRRTAALPPAVASPGAAMAQLPIPEPAGRRIKPTAPAPEPAVSVVPTVTGDTVRILFTEEQSTLTNEAASALDVMVQSLAMDENARIQLHAYAQDTGGNSNGTRRLSLARALSVRSYLMDAGVSSVRLDVRALGSRRTEGPPDRVDVKILRR